MRFEYAPYNGNWLPIVTVVFANGEHKLPMVGALVDTGATHTMLPMEMASLLGISIDALQQVSTEVAGGGECCTYPSPIPIEYILQTDDASETYRWKGHVYFALGQKLVLLGHHQCLENFDVLFRGRKRMLEIIHLSNKKSRR